MPMSGNTDKRTINGSIRLQLLTDGRATVARAVAFSDGGRTLATGRGSAWRDRSDKNDSETGELLATARALDSLAAQLTRKARGRIRHAETIKEHRALAAEHRAEQAAEEWRNWVTKDRIPLPDLSMIAGPPSLLQRFVESFTGKPGRGRR